MSNGMEINNGLKAIIDAMPLNGKLYLKLRLMPSVSAYIAVNHPDKFRFCPAVQAPLGDVMFIMRAR